MVMGLLAKLLMTKQLRFEDGVISLKDINLTLLPSFFIAELTKYYKKENNMSKFYFISWYWGYVLVRTVKERFKLDTPDHVYSLGMDLGEAMGLGLYKTHDYFPGRYTHFVIKTNPILKYFKNEKIDVPIDYFVSGAMAGGGCLVHNSVCQNVETKCMHKGDAECDFLTGTEKELKDRGLWDTAVKRYDLDKYYPLQKEIFNNYNEANEVQLLDSIINKIDSI
ncbi:MAG: hypothetical protein AB1467_01510 [Candidatus Diapherotrites archaeon]